MHGAGSVLASTRMDHSYVVLPKQKSQTPGVPPRPRAGAVQPEASQSVRAMEESFVVLPPPAASVYKSESAADGVGTHLPSPEGGQTNIPPQPNNSGFHTTITVLKRAFDIATTQTQVAMSTRLLMANELTYGNQQMTAMFFNDLYFD